MAQGARVADVVEHAVVTVRAAYTASVVQASGASERHPDHLLSGSASMLHP